MRPVIRQGGERIELSFARGRWARGFGAAIAAATVGFTSDEIVAIFTWSGPDFLGSWVLALALGALALPLPRALAQLRQPRGASIRWDEAGVSEWDGDGIRTAIRWEDARLYAKVIPAREGALALAAAEISDDDGRVIAVRTAPGGSEDRNAASFADVEWLVAHADGRTERIERCVTPGLLGTGSGGDFAGLLAAAAGYSCFVAAAIADPGPWYAAISAIAFAFLLVRRARRLGPLLRDPELLAGAEAVTLKPSDRGPLAVDAHGRERVLDLDALAHPDAMLERREGRAWLVAPAGSGGGYRGTDRVAPTALETDGARRARHAKRRSAAIELGLRAGLVVWVGLLALAS